jgi:hypothetical protein
MPLSAARKSWPSWSIISHARGPYGGLVTITAIGHETRIYRKLEIDKSAM